MKLRLCTAGLIALCLVGCNRSRSASPNVAAEDAAVAAARDVMRRGDAGVRDSEATLDASSGAHDSAAGGANDGGANDGGANDVQPRDADQLNGGAAVPPMAADAATPDPFAAEPEPSGVQIAIDFPPADARTDRSELRVRGRVLGARGGTLSWRGTTISVDDSGEWSTTVQLAPGRNALKFELALGGERSEAVRNVRSEPTLHLPAAVAIDPASGRAYVVDRDSLQSVDLESGERGLISGASRGQGPALSGATALTIDAAHKRAFIGANGPVLFVVDLETGDRSAPPVRRTDPASEVVALSVAADGRVLITNRNSLAWFDPAAGNLTRLDPQPSLSLPAPDPSAPFPMTIRHVTWNSGPEQAFIAVSGTSFSLFSVNLTTGKSSVVSDAMRGSGFLPLNVESMALDPDADVAYLAESNSAIVRVDLRTGDRTVVTDRDGRGTGPFSLASGKLVFDTAHHRLLAMFEEGLVDVHLDSGDRTPVTSNHTGAWRSLTMVHRLWATPAGNHVLSVVGSEENSRLLAFDLRTGADRVVVDKIPGDQLALDSSTSPLRAWVIERFGRVLWAVQLNDGERPIALSQGVGWGEPLRDPQAIAFDSRMDAKHAYIVDTRFPEGLGPVPFPPPALVRVDLVSGDRTIVSDEMTGTGPNGALALPVVDVKRMRVIGFSELGLLAIDIQSGQRRRLADLMAQDLNLSALAIDVDGDRALFASRENGLLGVDLESGQRAQLSGPGAGPEIDFVFGLTAVPQRRLAVLLCYETLIVVDLTSGQRVIIS